MISPINLKVKFYELTIYREIINALQENVFLTLDSNFGMELSIEFENGINNGTQLNRYSFNTSLIPASRTIEVLTDIEFDENKFINLHPNGAVWKGRLAFEKEKSNILKMIKQQNYDDYVTGGGTNVTDNFYRLEKERLYNMGAIWKCIYEEKEVDVNFK